MIIRVEKRALCRTNRKKTIGNVKIKTLCICRYFSCMPFDLGRGPEFLCFCIDLYYVICYHEDLKWLHGS